MNKRLLAALIGVGAGALLLGAYFAALRAGIHINPELVVAAAGAFAFAGTVAVFALVSMDRPAFRSARAAIPLNDEEPASRFIFRFKGDNVIQILARPEMSLGEILVRFGPLLNNTPGMTSSSVALTIKGSKKMPFATITLQQLFLTLKPFNLQHVLLMSDKDAFIGYIPGKRAMKEFTDDKAAEKITNYIVNVIADPAKSTLLREIAGVSSDDTIGETENARDAEAKLWANDAVQGLVIHRRLKPVGYISKVDLLTLNAGRP